MARSPLFDIYDPAGVLQQQAQYGLLPEDDLEPIGVAPIRRRPQLSDLMPEEEQRSMLGNLAEMGSSGLAGLGWILDTPGAMVRGGLSGGPAKALSALWETSDDRVTGRELLRQFGAAGKDDTWGNFAGGLGAEVLLDPMTYMSLGLNQLVGNGAKTLAGHAAAKAGLLQDFDVYARNAMKMGEREAMRKATAEQLLQAIPDETLRNSRRAKFVSAAGGEDALTAPLAKMNRVGLPGYEGAYDLLGESVGDAAAKLGDQLGEGLMTNPYTGPAARGLQAVFDPSVMGMTDYDRQWEAKGIRAAEKQRAITDRAKLTGLQFDANEALKPMGLSLNDPKVSDAFAQFMEQGALSVPGDLRDAFATPAMQALTGHFDEFRTQAIANSQKLGIPLEEFKSKAGVDFFPRQQAAFDVSESPKWPDGAVVGDRDKRPYSRGNKPVMLTDNYGASRRPYTDVLGGRSTLNKLSLDGELQAALRKGDREAADALLTKWSKDNLGQDMYAWVEQTNPSLLDDLDASHPLVQSRSQLEASQAQWAKELEAASILGDDDLARSAQGQLDAIKQQLVDSRAAIDKEQRLNYRSNLVGGMADFLRALDPQHARKNVPVFGQNSFNEMSRYAMGRGRVETQAKQMLDLLQKNVTNSAASSVPGEINYAAKDALQKLGFKGDTAERVLAEKLGVPDLNSVSFNKKFVDDWSRTIDAGRMPRELSPLMQKIDDFTSTFKTLALLWPARYTRDAYSGAFASAMRGSFNPIDWWAGTQLRKGNYDPLVKSSLMGLVPPRLAGIPEYEELLKTDPEAAIRKFLVDAGSQGIGTSIASDELLRGADTGLRGMYPGASAPQWSDIGRRIYNPDRTWWDAARDFNPFAVRGRNGNRNPLLELGDRAAETTDAGNRIGTYLNQIRQGADPAEAARITNLTQVNYSPDAFTDIEREILKRAAPFYSYSRGITPLIADEIVNRPAGLMGQSIRAITRGSAPSETNFTPDYLRQSAAIPLDSSVPFVGLDPSSGLKRYLTNIDLPFESVINLVTPGAGNTAFDAAGSTLQKTALNLLGQTNPLLKGPLEIATNRQFYSGRQLSDLYSMLEQTMGTPGRVAEQVLVNSPGGSRVVGAIRQAMDDRLDPREKWSKFAVNALTGLKLQDVDQERTRRLAARDMLNQLLETTPGVRTYENITVPEDVLRTMPVEQKKMYLLYKIIQSEASKRARDKKRQEAALDPLQVLGVIQ